MALKKKKKKANIHSSCTIKIFFFRYFFSPINSTVTARGITKHATRQSVHAKDVRK